MWAAARGQIEAVLGAPPRGSEHSSLLFKRMMMLWLVANSGAVPVLHAGASYVAPLLDQLGVAFLSGRAEVPQLPLGGVPGQLVLPGVLFGAV